MSAEHYSDVIMSSMASQMTGVSILCSTVCSGAHHRKHQSSTLLAFVRGIHRWIVDCPHKGPVTRKMFPYDDVIREYWGNLEYMMASLYGHAFRILSLCVWDQPVTAVVTCTKASKSELWCFICCKLISPGTKWPPSQTIFSDAFSWMKRFVFFH